MNKSLIVGAILVAGTAVMVPAVGWSADEPQPPAPGQTVPPPPAGGNPGARGHMRGHAEHMGMMHRWAEMSPQQRCERRIARRAARVAYVTSLLNLTPQQRPLLDKLRTSMQEAADKEHQLCAGLKPHDQRAKETVIDRINRREQFLTARLEAMRSAKPALQALYQSLTPEQKAIIDHPMRAP